MNTFTWADAVQHSNTTDGWNYLGYVIHLLEDLSSPAHTRNDCHPHLGLGFGDPDVFEVLTADRAFVLPGRSSALPSFSTPEEFLTSLQAYTRNNFFSNSTIFDPNLPGPTPSYSDADYFYDNRNRKIAYKTMRYRRSGNLRTAGLNETIVYEQFDELAPLTVLYVAGLIEFYHDTYSPPLNTHPTAGFTMRVSEAPSDTCTAPNCAINGQTLKVTVPAGGRAAIDVVAADCSPGPGTGCSYDPDGAIAHRTWTWNGNSVNPLPTGSLLLHLEPGTHLIGLTVEDNQGARSTAVFGMIEVTAGPPLPGSLTLVTTESGIVDHGGLDWSVLGNAIIEVANPFTIPVPGIPGLTITGSQDPGTLFARVDQSAVGAVWAGNFAPGERLLSTGSDRGPSGPMEFLFSSDISGFGVQIQADVYGPFTAVISAYDVGDNLLGTFSHNGNSTGDADDSAIFVGVVSTVQNIRRVVINVPTAAALPEAFAISSPRIQ